PGATGSSPASPTRRSSDLTFEQGVEFFEKEGYQSHANAVRETKRGTRDPTYLVYTLGKLQILKLRDDFRKKAGASFSLQRFHDEDRKSTRLNSSHGSSSYA